MEWWEAIIRLCLAVFIGCVIGIEREKKNRPAGMRTHVLVCVGAAMIAVMEKMIIQDTIFLNAMNGNSGISVSVGRITAQVVSGIGFLGAGTIFIAQKKISGLTTAASLWNAGCIGLVIGMGYYWIAVVGCAIVIITLSLLQRVVKVNAVKNVEVKFVHRIETLTFINEYFHSQGIEILDVDFHVENQGKFNLYTNMYTLDLKGRVAYKDIVTHLSEHPNIQMIRTRNT